ncbi:RNA polymerase sigma factor [Streptomyces sp. NPDC058335]|uniref:RNA polymerase sigma factor n=1 Tax=Streptomyces sp. NPDC058335 TaxID=3346451 RepID=UPI003666447B
MSKQANGKISQRGAETKLVSRAQGGDSSAFAALYTTHRDQVFAFLYNRTRDRHLAEDLTQETFARALHKIGNFSWNVSGGGFGAWLSVIARNLHLDHCKLSRTRLELSVGEMFDTEDDRDRSAETYAMRELDIAEATETVVMAMQSLTPYQRKCIELRFLAELSIPETAAALGKGIGATKTLQFRATQLMRKALTSEEAAA